ncbi:outer membrane protein [Thalassospira sp.]|uniref:outer membrane protein n=1 Tax=Thalassospira sp. TaxID=1912094 RepID=UPI002735B157|nr:outer membrane beta-barrel protein [Thalassospira sp.]MDP2698757.1 outer membrane beta-barrel protein [Thalassospira sp.]
MTCNQGITRHAIACMATVAISCMASGANATEPQNWQGLYGGLAIGGLHGASDLDSEANRSDYFSSQSDVDQLRPGLQKKIDGFSATGSGLLGYDYRHGNMLYGIEADLTLMNYSQTSNAGPVTFTSSPTVDFSTHTTIKTNFAFGVRPKIGYVFDNWMIHAAAGPSIGQFKYDFRYVDTNDSGQANSFEETNWALGVSSNIGASYNLGDGWSLRGDYVFSYYPEIINENQDFERFADLAAASFAGSFRHKADFQSHNVRFGLIRQF